MGRCVVVTQRQRSKEMKMSWLEEVRFLMFGFRWWLLFSFRAQGVFVFSSLCASVLGLMLLLPFASYRLRSVMA